MKELNEWIFSKARVVRVIDGNYGAKMQLIVV